MCATCAFFEQRMRVADKMDEVTSLDEPAKQGKELVLPSSPDAFCIDK